MASRRVLVVGGTGFIGAYASRALVRAGDHVVVLSRGGRAGPERAIVADRRDCAALERALRGERFDATIDFAAYDRGDVEALLGAGGGSLGRYVLISTGQVCLVTTAPRTPYREEDSAHPLIPEPPAESPDHRQWAYGVGKRGAEEAVERFPRSGLEATILRLPIVLGAGDASLRTWAYLERFLDGGPVLLPGGGTQAVRFLWAEDAARAVIEILRRGPLPSFVYHLAQPDIVPLREVLERMAALAGRAPEFVEVSGPELSAAGLDEWCSPYSGPWVSVLDPGLARRELGFTGTPIANYLEGVVRAHLERPPGRSHPGYARRAAELALAALR